MKKNATMLVIATALMLIIGLSVSAFSEDAAKTPAKVSAATAPIVAPVSAPATATTNCPSTCPKFVDNNHDGICDSMAVHHADGKCANMAQCMKDGRCTGNCKNHAAMMNNGTAKTSQTAVTCDPTKCRTMPGGCPMMTKGSCPGHK